MDGDGTALGTGRRKVPGPHAVICVSGLGGGAQEWTGVGAALAEGGALTTAQLPRRADGPGKGRSDPLNAGRLLVQREVHRAEPDSVVLIGHSWARSSRCWRPRPSPAGSAAWCSPRRFCR